MVLWLQGEVLPVPYRNMFQGLYTVRLDEGQEAQVPHCDMTLLYNDAEASSWVQDAATSQFPQDDNVAEPQAGFLQQQQQPQAGDGTHTCLTQGAPASLKAPKIKLPGVSLCNARPPAANPARHCGSMGNAHLSSEAATGAVHSQQEEAKERVVPQLRRTKRTVAQKRLASHDPSVPPSAGRSVQRKLSHGQHPGGSDSSRASVRETHAVPVAHTASPAAKLGSQVLTAEQKADDPQLSGWELDSDDDLFVDLSGANILRTVSSGLQGIHPSATHVTALEDGESVAM